MSEFISRLIDERDELSERLDKLKAFLGTEAFLKTVEASQQVLLWSQSGLMQGYLNTLNKRIDLLEVRSVHPHDPSEVNRDAHRSNAVQ